jgi:hypothetical protein
MPAEGEGAATPRKPDLIKDLWESSGDFLKARGDDFGRTLDGVGHGVGRALEGALSPIGRNLEALGQNLSQALTPPGNGDAPAKARGGAAETPASPLADGSVGVVDAPRDVPTGAAAPAGALGVLDDALDAALDEPSGSDAEVGPPLPWLDASTPGPNETGGARSLPRVHSASELYAEHPELYSASAPLGASGASEEPPRGQLKRARGLGWAALCGVLLALLVALAGSRCLARTPPTTERAGAAGAAEGAFSPPATIKAAVRGEVEPPIDPKHATEGGEEVVPSTDSQPSALQPLDHPTV